MTVLLGENILILSSVLSGYKIFGQSLFMTSLLIELLLLVFKCLKTLNWNKNIFIQKKVVYSTVKLRPEQVDWLRKQKRGIAAKIFEAAVDDAMLSTQNVED